MRLSRRSLVILLMAAFQRRLALIVDAGRRLKAWILDRMDAGSKGVGDAATGIGGERREHTDPIHKERFVYQIDD